MYPSSLLVYFTVYRFLMMAYYRLVQVEILKKNLTPSPWIPSPLTMNMWIEMTLSAICDNFFHISYFFVLAEKKDADVEENDVVIEPSTYYSTSKGLFFQILVLLLGINQGPRNGSDEDCDPTNNYNHSLLRSWPPPLVESRIPLSLLICPTWVF